MSRVAKNNRQGLKDAIAYAQASDSQRNPIAAQPNATPKRESRLESVLVRIELSHVQPPIWRSFVVPVEISMHKFHQAIQVVMGWRDAHLYEFRAGDEICALPNPDGPEGILNSRRERLDHWLDDGMPAVEYTYDLGDSWHHWITFGETRFDGPKCLDGARACPPEDCGGPPGYEELVQALADPAHPQSQELKAWAGKWRSEAFDLEAVNRKLGKITFGRRAYS